MSKVRSRFVQDVGILTLANFISAILSFVQGILVARWLGPELYGVAALVMSFPNLLYTFFDARSSDVSVKYLSEFHARGESKCALAMCKFGYFVDFIISSIAFTIVLATASWAARNVAHRPEMSWLIVLFAFAFLPRSFVNTSHAVLATLGCFSIVAALETIATLLRTILVLGLVMLGWQVNGVIWGNAVATTITGLLYGIIGYIFVHQTWGASWISGRLKDLKNRRAIIRLLALNDFNALLGMIAKQIDIVLLGYFRNPTEVGYYKLARNLANVVGYVVHPLQWVTYPELARLWGIGDQKGFRKRVQKLAWQMGVPLSLLILMSGFTLIPIILPLLVGDVYRPTIIAAQILLIGSATWLAFFWLRPFYLAMDYVKEWTIGIALYSLAWLVLSLLIMPVHGYVGMAWCILIVTVAFHTLMGLRVCHGTFRSSRSSL